MICANLFGGPSVGKSTTAAGVFSELKQRGVNCEYVHEWIKWSVWEKRQVIFDDQLYIFAKQHHMLHTLDGQVDVAICDSPLLLSNIYGNMYNNKMSDSDTFSRLVIERFNRFDNYNVVLGRKKAYNPMGRVQNEDEAKGIDDKIRRYLNDGGFPYINMDGDAKAIPAITELVMEML